MNSSGSRRAKRAPTRPPTDSNRRQKRARPTASRDRTPMDRSSRTRRPKARAYSNPRRETSDRPPLPPTPIVPPRGKLPSIDRATRRPAEPRGAAGAAPGRATAPTSEPRPGERLQKFLARAGVASRRQCEDLIAAGRVQVNGAVVRTTGTRVRPEVDHVSLDGVRLRPEAPVTVMLHKPAGYITAVSDPEGRPVVLALLPKAGLPRLFPVGRLDWDTEGLLLLTNDGR